MRVWIAGILLALGLSAVAGPPELQQPLPAVTVQDRGELVLEGEEFGYRPWRSGGVGKVQVLQYIPATRAGEAAYKPLTDRLQQVLAVGSFHVSTVLNLDAALWGTSGLVVSEAKKNKRRYPDATIVLDKKAAVGRAWGVEKPGRALVILDAMGTVHYFSTEPAAESGVDAQIALVRRLQQAQGLAAAD